MARSHVARGLMSAKMLWMQHATSWDSITAEEDRKLSLPEQIYLQARIPPGERLRAGRRPPLMARIDEQGQTIPRMELRRQKAKRAPPVAEQEERSGMFGKAPRRG